MSDHPVLKITSVDVLGCNVNLSLDGVPLTSVMDVVLHIEAKDIIRATITMLVAVDAELPADVTIINSAPTEPEHRLVADHNGEPSCLCGWTPHPPEYSTRMDAVSGVHRHVATFIGMP